MGVYVMEGVESGGQGVQGPGVAFGGQGVQVLASRLGVKVSKVLAWRRGPRGPRVRALGAAPGLHLRLGVVRGGQPLL